MQVERYKELNGHYPELVQVDKIYLNRTNRAWLKERNIRHTGNPLGRKPARTVKSYYMRRKERREAAERNQIEGKFGQGNIIQPESNPSQTVFNLNELDSSIIFVMNVIRYCRDFSGSLLKWIFANVMKMREQILLTMMPNRRILGFDGIIQ